MITKNPKPSLLFETKHLDYAGGGTHSRQIIYLLSKYFKVYCKEDIFNISAKYNEDIPSFDLSSDIILDPDVYITVDHSGKVKPKGKINIVISFYPNNSKPKGFDYAICANEFVKNAIHNEWGMKSFIIPPFRNHQLYEMKNKENSCITIGNFFLDNDGFSKNQHLLISWYIKNKKALNLSRFELFGFPNNPGYVELCKKLAEDHRDIFIRTDAPRSQIRESLAKSNYLLHAHGYGRKKPDQVEHFGIIAVEALLSGTLPIVHQSGGCSEIKGVQTFIDFDGINNIIKTSEVNLKELRSFGEFYSLESIQPRIIEIANKIIDALNKEPKSFFSLLRKLKKVTNS